MADRGYISCCSGTSRKTRIETGMIITDQAGQSKVAVELPEKQGLKRTLYNFYDSKWTVLQWNFQKNKD